MDKGLFIDLVVPQQLVQVLVVSPGHHQVLHAAVGLVHAKLGAEGERKESHPIHSHSTRSLT